MNKISKELNFFIFLLEQYAVYKNETSYSVLKRWDGLELTELIFDMYEIYHIEAIENAFDDIDSMISEKQAAFEK